MRESVRCVVAHVALHKPGIGKRMAEKRDKLRI
jgi:hypothetical protein